MKYKYTVVNGEYNIISEKYVKRCAKGNDGYLQFTPSVTVVSRRSPSAIALFQTTHRNFAPSSSRRGVIERVDVVR